MHLPEVAQLFRAGNGLHPQYCWDFPEEVPGKIGETPDKHSEHNLELPTRVRQRCPNPYKARHGRHPKHLQKSLPQYRWGRVSLQKWFRRGPLKPNMELPAVLGVCLS